MKVRSASGPGLVAAHAAPHPSSDRRSQAKNKKRPPFAMYGWNNEPIGYWKNKETNNVRASREVSGAPVALLCPGPRVWCSLAAPS